MLNATLLWPICLVLYFTGIEVIQWDKIPWLILIGTSFFTLGKFNIDFISHQLDNSCTHAYFSHFPVTHLIGSFSQAITYDLFVTLGLITSVPASAGELHTSIFRTVNFGGNFRGTDFTIFSALDIMLYGSDFYGMRFAGIILIATGFFLVMFPDNWPDYITRSLRFVHSFFPISYPQNIYIATYKNKRKIATFLYSLKNLIEYSVPNLHLCIERQIFCNCTVIITNKS